MQRSRFSVPVRGGWCAALTMALALPLPAVLAQETPPARPDEAPAVGDRATRFHFAEHYDPNQERSRLDSIGPYRVAIRETFKTLIENPQGAPDQDEWTAQSIFSERPAQQREPSSVSAVVRRYEVYREDPPDPDVKPSRTRPLEGLTVWYQSRPNAEPQILSLSPGRALWEDEYTIASQQVFLPELAALLPSAPRRIGEQWSISATAARALLGGTPGRGETLTGTLLEVRTGAQGSVWEAVLGVTGRVVLPTGASKGNALVNARLGFQFPTPSPPDPALARSGKDAGIVEARGAIMEVRMALSTTVVPDANTRLREVTTREVVLGRQLTVPGVPLTIPDPAPAPTEANSWLTFDDPLGRFHFRHPQDSRLVTPPDDTTVILRDSQPGWPDNILIRLLPRNDRQQRDPEYHRQQLNEAWGRLPADVVRGPSGWLPEADWAASKLKVYRIEAAFTRTRTDDRAPRRVHADYYLVLSPRDEGLFVTSTTVQDPPLPFRDQVEAILKTFRFVPAETGQARQ